MINESNRKFLSRLTKDQLDHHSVLLGISDDQGIDLIYVNPENKAFKILDFRAIFNSHRNPEIFLCIIPDNTVDSLLKHPRLSKEVLNDHSIMSTFREDTRKIFSQMKRDISKNTEEITL